MSNPQARLEESRARAIHSPSIHAVLDTVTCMYLDSKGIQTSGVDTDNTSSLYRVHVYINGYMVIYLGLPLF